jgi:hypothetical protein
MNETAIEFITIENFEKIFRSKNEVLFFSSVSPSLEIFAGINP